MVPIGKNVTLDSLLVYTNVLDTQKTGVKWQFFHWFEIFNGEIHMLRQNSIQLINGFDISNLICIDFDENFTVGCSAALYSFVAELSTSLFIQLLDFWGEIFINIHLVVTW